MFVTSRGTMDKLDSGIRELLSTRAEFFGAIRLPNDAFKRNAGTEVTTDIVMLRRLRPGEAPTGPAWKETVDYTNDLGENSNIYEYFVPRTKSPNSAGGSVENSLWRSARRGEFPADARRSFRPCPNNWMANNRRAYSFRKFTAIRPWSWRASAQGI